MALDAPVLRCGLLSEAEGEVVQARGAFDVSGNKQKGGIHQQQRSPMPASTWICQVSLLLTAQQKVGGASPIQQSLGLQDHESQLVNFVRFA